MVGFLSPTIAAPQPPCSVAKLKSSDSFCLDEPDDLSDSFADSFLDFDSMKDWIEENPETSLVQPKSEPAEIGSFLLEGTTAELGSEDLLMIDEEMKKICLEVLPGASSFSLLNDGEEARVFEKGLASAPPLKCEGNSVKIEELVGTEVTSKIQNEDLVKKELDIMNLPGGDGREVSLNGLPGVSVLNGSEEALNARKIQENDALGAEESSSSGSEDHSSSTSSATSSSDDDEDEDEDDESDHMTEEGDKKGRVQRIDSKEHAEIERISDAEEGEIREPDIRKMVCWSDGEGEGDEVGVSHKNGPIRSKNELEILPFVPPVEVTLGPHHQIHPLGSILSIVGAKVIVEGLEKHNPLNEGSILWVTENRCPLGVVDEIFGPVKNPFYVVRFNSESELPSGIQQGMRVSFVSEFASHVLNDSSLFKKGYDASGENDEELSEGSEFSDDEKEAEYKKNKKLTKRGFREEGKLRNMENNDYRKSRNHNGGIHRRNERMQQAVWNPTEANSNNGNRQQESMGVPPRFAQPFPQLNPPAGFGFQPNGMMLQQQQQQQQMLMGAGYPSQHPVAWLPIPHNNAAPPNWPFNQACDQTMLGFPFPASFCALPALAPWPPPGCNISQQMAVGNDDPWASMNVAGMEAQPAPPPTCGGHGGGGGGGVPNLRQPSANPAGNQRGGQQGYRRGFGRRGGGRFRGRGRSR